MSFQKHGQKRRRSNKTESRQMAMIKNLLLAFLLTVLFAGALLTVAAMILGKTGNPLRYLTPVGLTILFFSSFFAGVTVSALSHHRMALTGGMLMGVFLSLLLLICSLILHHTGQMEWRAVSFLKILPVFLFTSLGSLAFPQKERHHHR